MSAERSEPAVGKVSEHIETYKVIAEWIRFADTKAAATLTVNGVLLGLLIPTLKTYLTDNAVHPTPWWPILVVGLFLIWLGLLVLSASFAFLCVLPFRGLGRRLALDRTSHFHPAAVATSFSLQEPDRFIASAEKAGMEGLNREVLVAILIDAHLSNAKYGYVTRAIWSLAGSVFFGLLYLLTTQL
jgi:hypothetical protein